MRKKLPDKLEERRIVSGYMATRPRDPYGAFEIYGPRGAMLAIVASDGRDPLSASWEHVSVSTKHRVPNWQEMCFVKDLFWDDDECVVQFHPPKSDYVNCHPNCLHLWKPPYAMAMPNPLLVGDKGPAPQSAAEAIERQQKIIRENWK